MYPYFSRFLSFFRSRSITEVILKLFSSSSLSSLSSRKDERKTNGTKRVYLSSFQQQFFS